MASGSGSNLWVWLLGVVVRRYIDFLILLIPTPLVSVLFYSSIPTFCFSFFTNKKVRGLFPLFEKWVNICLPCMPLPNYLFRHEALLQAVRVHETSRECPCVRPVSACMHCAPYRLVSEWWAQIDKSRLQEIEDYNTLCIIYTILIIIN